MDQAGPQLSQVVRAATSNTNTFGQPLQASIANPLPNGVNKPLGRSQPVLNSLLGVAGLWARESNVPYGYTQQWNLYLAVERQANSEFDSYCCLRWRKRNTSPHRNAIHRFQLNQLPDSYDSLGARAANPSSEPFLRCPPANELSRTPTIAEGYLLLPHPQYPLGLLQQSPRYGSSTYHALQVGYVQRFGHAGTYTWGKVLSDTDNTSEFQDGQGDTGERQDEYNPRVEKSISLQETVQQPGCQLRSRSAIGTWTAISL